MQETWRRNEKDALKKPSYAAVINNCISKTLLHDTEHQDDLEGQMFILP